MGRGGQEHLAAALLGLLGDSPEFFVARGNTRLDIVVLALRPAATVAIRAGIPLAVIEARADMKGGRDLQKDIPLVTVEDFREAGAIAFGTPTRFGNVSSQLKNQIDQLTSLWLKGELEGKPAGVFVSTGSLHGGQETTILTLMAPLLHLGMILVGVPYSVQELFTTQGGGSPYGPGHVAGDDNRREIDRQEATICRALGRRLAEVGLRLGKQ